MPQVLAEVAPNLSGLEITHQTGAPMLAEIKQLYQDLKLKASAISFIDNMPKAFLEHDLLISRAGATVCAEITASGTPAILVPYPFANGHQKKNAEALSQINAAITIEEDGRFKDHLASTIKTLYNNRNTLIDLAKNAKTLATPKAALVIVSTILNEL